MFELEIEILIYFSLQDLLLEQLLRYYYACDTSNDVVVGSDASTLILSIVFSLQPLGSGIRRDSGRISCAGIQETSY